MKKFGFTAVVAGGLVAGVLGLAGPAQAAPVFDGSTVVAPASVTDVRAGIDHHGWLFDIQPQVNVPHVDTTVQQSR